ncbi:uncharacterized protein T551_02339 [Pneumocystis jirovecii RU7]|uniref:Pre-mRNA-splicing factor ISY1 n=1 Tax=Pneumocystis jirovecii (strain RU7) TaxID=1408657 RepID=A0A0W4ZL09_PNEJ7|nr:uncharacterized protein T551_02339 [Pneumocystis jirovecii RU7]KTW29065.1 hypothetical protein T551_02339 [Pneumocystis jirovecii RU7]
MARNSEKAQSMLYRFRASQAAELGIIDTGSQRRPKLITEVDSIQACEKWRGQVVKEISRKISKIQDPSLTDYQIRDLNDDINRMMREKHMWEIQLRNLGGPNYMRFGPKMVNAEGREIPGHRGYKYFGRAKELPGVKELFDELVPKPPPKPKISEAIYKNLDAVYFGYQDENDEELLEFERQKEQLNMETMLNSKEGEPKEDWRPIEDFYVPNQKEIEKFLLERRKKKLLEKYAK